MYTSRNVGLWAIGSRWILRDRPNDFTLGNDYMTQEYLRNVPNLNIPLIKEMRLLSEPEDQIHLTLMSRVEGEPLIDIWGKLSQADKTMYAKELAGYIRQWRKLTSSTMKKVNGDQLDDRIVGTCFSVPHPLSCKTMGKTVDEWLENLSPELRKGLSDIKLRELKERFPRGYPNVLTHGDLHLGNILVKDGKIQAIIDWESAGFYPSWAESWLISECNDDGTNEMLELLWSDGCLDFNLVDLQEKICPGVDLVKNAWDRQRNKVEHPDEHKRWLRPPFCDCKRYGGSFQWTLIGNRPVHRIKD
jgi:hypothetical protein